MNPLLLILSLLSATVVLVRCICMASRLNRRDWYGHPMQFVALALSYGLSGGGALGIPLGFQHGPVLLLVGVAGWVVFDCRNKTGG